MSYLLDHHRAVVDPFSHGHLAPQLGFMMPMTRGTQFPWINGGVALMRRELYPDLHAWEYCGLAIGADTQIKNFPGFDHKADQAYWYAAVSFLGNGMVSAAIEPIRLDFDSGGNLIQPLLPNFPIDAVAEPLAAGKFRCVWEYPPYGHGGYPTDFQVFEGATPATVDYGTPLTDSVTGLTVVAVVGDQGVYSFTTGSYSNGTAHVFGVRGRNSGGVAELNTYTTASAKARSVTPTDAASALTAYVKPYSRLGAT